ncbi:TPA: hypothetical protein ACIVPY_004611, partial [Salmonella enterica subsp. enterica serovar Agona]
SEPFINEYVSFPALIIKTEIMPKKIKKRKKRDHIRFALSECLTITYSILLIILRMTHGA